MCFILRTFSLFIEWCGIYPLYLYPYTNIQINTYIYICQNQKDHILL